MKVFDEIIDGFCQHLSDCEQLSETKIVRAYPMSYKPTILKKPYIAVGLTDMQFSDLAVGEEQKIGKYSVSCNIYVPTAMGEALAEKLFSYICTAVFDFDMKCAKAESLIYDKVTDCYLMKTIFSYHDETDFGGFANE